MKNLMFCFGTRPEAIKMAPLIKLAPKFGFKPIVCLSGQHKNMVVPFMNFFDLQSDFDLDVMKPNQSLGGITSGILTGMSEVFKKIKPDCMVVQGDTTTTFSSALAAFYDQVPVAHVEAGLRTNDRYSPFPEEVNRLMVSSLASFHYPPTKETEANLLNEKVRGSILVTGNTSIDALKIASGLIDDNIYKNKYSNINFNKKIVLVTTHRRENHGTPLLNICKAVKEIADKHDAEIVLPVHLNPNVQQVVQKELRDNSRIHLMSPLDYPDFVFFMKTAYIIMTDSGGVQEEGPYFGKPILVLRDNTERVEGVAAGTSLLIGTSYERILNTSDGLFRNSEEYLKFSKAANPYGNGDASAKILKDLQSRL